MKKRIPDILIALCLIFGLIYTFGAPFFAYASVSATNLETSGNNVDQTSYATGSITPGANDLILAWVYSISATAAATPTASGDGLTWVQVATIDDQGNGTGLRRLTLFRAMGASPTTGSITFSFGAQTQTGGAWSVVQYTGMDTTGTNGSGAIVQAVTNFSATNATSLTVTLGAFSSVNNATVGGFGIPLNTAGLPAVGSGFTTTGQRNQATPNLAIGSEFRSDNSTTVNMTSAAASVPWTGIAVEIKQAVVAVAPPVLLIKGGQLKISGSSFLVR